MQKLMLSALVAVALVLSACDQQSSVTSPVSNGSSVEMVKKMAGDLNLSMEQMSVVDEMFYLEEDLSIVLTNRQVSLVNGVINPDGTTDERGKIDRRRGVDMAAIMWFQLALRANPDMTQETKDAIKAAIAANYEARMQAIKDAAGDPAKLKELLEKLHTELMAEINRLLGPDAVAKTQALKEELERQREELRKKMDELRIERQVLLMTNMLGLDEKQAAAVKSALVTKLEAIAKAREENAGNPEALREALKNIEVAFQTALKEALGDELYTKWLRLSRGKIGPIGPGGRG
jgi:hypothetical protein